ncbi:MAG: imelysin family protein [Pseudomonadota bacterium]
MRSLTDTGGIHALVCLFMTIVLAGCVNDGQGPEPPVPENPALNLRQTLERSLEGAILPAVNAFLAEAQALDTAAEGFCAVQDAIALEELQRRWKSTFEQWYRLVLYKFGPLDDNFVFPAFTFIDGLRLRGTNYLETVRAEIVDDLDDVRVLDDAYFGSKTFQRVGLLALESAIFETSTPEHSTDAAAILSEYGFQPRKCDVLLGLSGQLLSQAQYVENGWTTEHLDTGRPFRELFLAGELEDGTEPLSQVIISSQEFLDYLQARNVVITAAQVSQHAWQAIAASIDEVELLLRGERGEAGSIFDFMESVGRLNEIAAVEDSLRQVRQSIADRDPAMLEITLGFLDGNFKREIPDSLDIDLGINFTDGD